MSEGVLKLMDLGFLFEVVLFNLLVLLLCVYNVSALVSD
jgi:hypothetical protein